MGKNNRIRVIPASQIKEMTRGEIRAYGLEMCMNGNVDERLKCLDKVLSWTDQEIRNYLWEILGNPERTFYERYPDYYNAVFREAVKENREFVSQIGQ